MRLDYKPSSWEQRISLYAAYLVDKGTQLSTLKSYFSAIKKILWDDGFELNTDTVLLNTLARACKTVNDTVTAQLPIKSHLLAILLFEVERLFNKQHYLEIMYKSIFLLAYYGLLRIGELTSSPHTIKAANVSIGQNKDKIIQEPPNPKK